MKAFFGVGGGSSDKKEVKRPAPKEIVAALKKDLTELAVVSGTSGGGSGVVKTPAELAKVRALLQRG